MSYTFYALAVRDKPEKHNSQIGYEHEIMHHGGASRRGASLEAYHIHRSDLNYPLHVYHSGSYIPDVFSPDYKLVVSPRVHANLRGIPNIVFLPIIVARAVDFFIEKGDFKAIDAYIAQSEEDDEVVDLLPMRLPDIRAWHDRFNGFVEVIGANYYHLAPTAGKQLEITIGAGTDTIMLASPTMIDTFPIIELSLAWICRRDVFQALRPYLDLDFYEFQSFTIEE